MGEYMVFRLFLVVLTVLFSVPAVAAASLADRVQEHRLANGATVLFVERHGSPTVSAYISFKVGSVNETSEQRGAAHLLEHMLFKGTRVLGTKNYAEEKPLLDRIETVGGKIDRLKNLPESDPVALEKMRAELKALQKEHKQLVVKDEFSKIYAENGGVGFNAFTGKDQTTYLINLPANKLELWAAIESDRLANAVFREFYTERDVVYEERRRSYESNPNGLLYESLLATAFKVHPYRGPTIGWGSDIANLTPDDIRSLYSRYYTPANMVITLVGDFHGDNALALIKRYFGKLPSGEQVPPVTAVEPTQQGERRIKVRFDAEPGLMIAYHKPAAPQREDYVFDLLMEILGAGRTSRLYRALVLDKQLATDVGVFSAPGSRYPNLMIVSATPRQGVAVSAIEEAIYRELDLLRQGVTAAELDKARRQITTSLLRRMQSNSGLARTLSSFEVLGGWRYLEDYQQQIESVSAEELAQVARRYLTADNRTVALVGRDGD